MLAGHAQSRSQYKMRLREIWIDLGRFFQWFHCLQRLVQHDVALSQVH